MELVANLAEMSDRGPRHPPRGGGRQRSGTPSGPGKKWLGAKLRALAAFYSWRYLARWLASRSGRGTPRRSTGLAPALRGEMPAGFAPDILPAQPRCRIESVATEVERRCHAEPPRDGHASTRDRSRPAFVVVRLGSGPGDAHSSWRTPCARDLYPQVGQDGPALRRGAVGPAKAPARNTRPPALIAG